MKLGFSNPIIILSRYACDEVVIKCIKLGAHDYILKNNLQRLVPAVNREMDSARSRKEQNLDRIALGESERRYALMVDSAFDAIICFDRDNIILTFNKAAQRVFGYTEEKAKGELVGKFLPQLFYGEHQYEINSSSNHSLLLDQRTSQLGESIGINSKGEEVSFELSVSFAIDHEQTIFTLILRDMREKKRLETQLLHAQKIGAIAEFSAGIAHDFNNVLSAIFGYAEVIKFSADNPHDVKENIENVLIAAKRGKNLVMKILSLGKREPATYGAVSLDNEIEETITFLNAVIPPKIKIIKKIDEKKAFVFADPTGIHQILMNLCVNATHSLGNSPGTIEIGLKKFSVESELQTPFGDLSIGEYVELRISDSGRGIPKENLAMIFEPFYTTNETGKGTGLGLAMVKKIVEEANGIISVESDVGIGTTFKVFLPRIEHREDQSESFAIPRKQTGRVLYVDDEEILLDAMKKMLEIVGYESEVTSNPHVAYNLFESNPDNYDLLITDSTMPEMEGATLVSKFRKLRPNIPVIFCSGYSDTGKFNGSKSDSFLQKPFALDKLSYAVKQAIGHAEK